MKVALVPLLLLLLCGSSLGWWRHRYRPSRPTPAPINNQPTVGESCTPHYRTFCGTMELIREQTVTANGFGPNVCTLERTYRKQAFSYERRQSCWNTWRGRRCYVSCRSTGRCDSSAEVVKRKTSCCDGFAINPASTSHKYAILRREGCTIRLENSTLDCLQKLNLTQFGSLLSTHGLQESLSNQNGNFTVFAVNNSILMNVNADRTTIASHIANITLTSRRLFNGRNLSTVAPGRFLAVTKVSSNPRRWFVNGVEIKRPDACQARNGVVHVVDGIISTSNRTILELLEATPELSRLNQLVRKANLGFLMCRKLTVFAPNNEAIDENLANCLCQSENSQRLKDFLKFHFVSEVEYSSTIRLRSSLFKCCTMKQRHHHHRYGRSYYWHYWKKTRICRVPVAVESNTISVAGSNIVTPDIGASNGVIHVVSRILTNPCLDIATVCPPSPTTPSPTSPTTPSPPSPSPSPSSLSPPPPPPPPPPPSSSMPSPSPSPISRPPDEGPITNNPPTTRPPDEGPITNNTASVRPPDEGPITNGNTPPSRPPDEGPVRGFDE